MKKFTYETALSQSSRLKAGEISAVELMQSTLDRIGAVNGEINAPFDVSVHREEIYKRIKDTDVAPDDEQSSG